MRETRNRPLALVADDEPDIRKLIQRILCRAGWDVAVAGDGQEAWESAVTLRPDILILDLLMPRLTGYAVIRRLRADPSSADVPVVVLSGLRPDRHPGHLRLEDKDTYLAKPFVAGELVSAVSRLARPVPNNQTCPVSAGAFGPLANPKELSAWPAS